MALREELEKQGTWLFRWRSYLPLIGIAMFIHAATQFHFPGAVEEIEDWGEIISMMFAYCGLLVRSLVTGYKAKGTSGRNTKEQVAMVLNTTGMYSIVRNPLYLGNFIIWVGISTFFRFWWLTLLVVFIFWIYYERIIFAEEEFLRKKFGEHYLAWSQHTPAFLPKLRNWKQPELPFSLKKTIRQEYAGFYAIICIFTFLEIIGRYFSIGKIGLDTRWLISV